MVCREPLLKSLAVASTSFRRQKYQQLGRLTTSNSLDRAAAYLQIQPLLICEASELCTEAASGHS